MKYILSLLILLCSELSLAQETSSVKWKLEVSSNHRFLQHADGTPFFWLGNTAWLMPSVLDREESTAFLSSCEHLGYNVIQVQVLNGVPSVNAYGCASNTSKDDPWDMTSVDSAGQNSYWKHMDFIVKEAEKHNIYVGMTCIWGGLVKSGLLDVEGARRYGTFLAERYKDSPNIIWIIGGDIQGNVKHEVWSMLATTIKSIDRNHLMTFHPRGRCTSAKWWSAADWLDFNMYQSGHRSYGQRMNDKSYPIQEGTEEDCWMYVDSTRAYQPLKPVIDGEPSYEDIPKGLHFPEGPRWCASDIRRYAYWDVFAGTCGHTYGHNAIMQMHKEGRKIAYANTCKTWQEALKDSGCVQMQYVKALMLSLPYFKRVCDQSVIYKNNGIRYDRLICTRGDDYLLIYNYSSRDMDVDLTRISGKRKNVWWMDTQTGVLTYLGTFKNGRHTFHPLPSSYHLPINDGVLIAIDSAKSYIGIEQNNILR